MDRATQVIQEIAREISRFPSVERVILFGSRARGDNAERADIDIAVEAPAAGEREWLDIYFLADEIETLLKIDMLRLEEAPEYLKQQIASEGKILYERSENHVRHS